MGRLPCGLQWDLRDGVQAFGVEADYVGELYPGWEKRQQPQICMNGLDFPVHDSQELFTYCGLGLYSWKFYRWI